MARPGAPPAYAWDWFARQRLPWREVRTRLVAAGGPVGARYASVEARGDVLALLRVDYDREPAVRSTVDRVVTELVFLGRTGVPFADLGLRTPPRGLRWWWTALTGEDLDVATPRAAPPADAQLTLDEVHTGYGDPG